MADTEAEAPETTEAAGPAVAAVIVSDAPIALEGHALIDTLDKDQLEAYAREQFGRELDKRKRLTVLHAEVKALFDGTTQSEEVAVQNAVEAAERRASTAPTHARHRTLKNPETGDYWVFEWNPLYEGNADLEPIHAE